MDVVTRGGAAGSPPLHVFPPEMAGEFDDLDAEMREHIDGDIQPFRPMLDYALVEQLADIADRVAGGAQALDDGLPPRRPLVVVACRELLNEMTEEDEPGGLGLAGAFRCLHVELRIPSDVLVSSIAPLAIGHLHLK